MIVDCAAYTRGKRHPGSARPRRRVRDRPAADDDTFSCGSACTTLGPREFESVATEFEPHPPAVEDAIHAHQRPKLELYGDMLFLVIKTARYDDAREAIEFAELQMLAGKGYLVTGATATPAEALAPAPAGRFRGLERLAWGRSAAVYAADRVVDEYEPVLDGLDNDIAEIESVFSDDRTNPAARIYSLLLKEHVGHELPRPVRSSGCTRSSTCCTTPTWPLPADAQHFTDGVATRSPSASLPTCCRSTSAPPWQQNDDMRCIVAQRAAARSDPHGGGVQSPTTCPNSARSGATLRPRPDGRARARAVPLLPPAAASRPLPAAGMASLSSARVSSWSRPLVATPLPPSCPGAVEGGEAPTGLAHDHGHGRHVLEGHYRVDHHVGPPAGDHGVAVAVTPGAQLVAAHTPSRAGPRATTDTRWW